MGTVADFHRRPRGYARVFETVLDGIPSCSLFRSDKERGILQARRCPSRPASESLRRPPAANWRCDTDENGTGRDADE